MKSASSSQEQAPDQPHHKAGSAAAGMILFAAACWGTIGLFSRPLAAAGLTPTMITTIRGMVAAVTFLGMVLVKNRALLRIRLRDVWVFVCMGLISYVATNLCYFKAMETVSLSTAAILMYTAPAFVVLLSALIFKEQLTKRKLLALVLAMAGCVLVAGVGALGMTWAGFLYGLGSGFFYATYSLFANVALKKYPSLTVTCYTFVFALLGLVALCDAPSLVATVVTSPTMVFNALGLGIIATVLPYLFYTMGLSRTQPGRASIMATLEPVVATVVGMLVFSERLTLPALFGMVLVGVAVMLLNLKGKKPMPAPAMAVEPTMGGDS